MSLEYRVFQTCWGFMGLVGHHIKARSLVLPLPAPELVQKAIGQKYKESLVKNPALLPHLTEQLTAYFAGSRIETWKCELGLASLPDFTRRVLLVTARIPYGTVQTYGELARDVGCSRGARAVGQALKRNPLPIIIPCHRVVAAGGLGGFTAPGGLETKQALLQWEGFRRDNR